MSKFKDIEWQKIWNIKKLKNLFGDNSLFRMVTVLKMMTIPVLSLTILSGLIWMFLRINLAFFEVNGFIRIDELRVAYFDYILSSLVDITPYLIIFIVINGVIGAYISELLVRPFKLIGNYCENRRNAKGDICEYDPDFFSELRLLTVFSEYFFNIADNAIAHKQLLQTKIPEKFTKIHKPVFERGYFLQFSVFILMTSICAIIGIYIITVDTYGNIIQLSIEALKQSATFNHFFKEQKIILDFILWGVIIFHVLLSFLLSFHLYSKVSVPAFAIFATMRGFLKGTHESRVHLIGFSNIRPYCHQFNKYLDFLQEQVDKESNLKK
ncbi:MAG: hypothetical protein ISR65_01425 [Bacteriovoracaceae bacterium]|nr:hypothetical protein [Bacteriovoracaceae bacterium]